MKKEQIYHSFKANPKIMYEELKKLVRKTSANDPIKLTEILEKGIKLTIDSNDNIIGFKLNFEELVLCSDTKKEYLIKMKEEVIFSLTNDTEARVYKFSNEVRSENSNFFLRFDFKRDAFYPNYHINAPEDIYGDYHLIPCPYPGWEGECHTNLDIRKISPLKSLKIFMLFIKSKKDPICHEENAQYINILEKGERV